MKVDYKDLKGCQSGYVTNHGTSFRRPCVKGIVSGKLDSMFKSLSNWRRGGSKISIEMRKRQISTTPPSAPPSGQAWLDVERTALVEVTSEENGYPIESALLGTEDRGWRAVNSGTQTIRLIFDEPQRLRRIWLVFEESENTRTQEFILRWSPDAGHSFREVVRQQWNFSSPGSIREIEDYAVELSDVTVLELIIVPDISGGAARASLASLRLA